MFFKAELIYSKRAAGGKSRCKLLAVRRPSLTCSLTQILRFMLL